MFLSFLVSLCHCIDADYDYNARIFTGMCYVGSPYKMEIIDASEVEVSGDGITSAEVNHRSAFHINLGRNGVSRDIRVHITSKFYELLFEQILNNFSFSFTDSFFRFNVGVHQQYITDAHD